MKLNDFKLVSVCFFIKLNSLTTENMGPTCLCFCVLYKCIHQDCIGKECDIYVRIYYIWRKIRDWGYDISKMQLSLIGMQKCLYFEKIGIAFRLQIVHFRLQTCVSITKVAFRFTNATFRITIEPVWIVVLL